MDNDIKRGMQNHARGRTHIISDRHDMGNRM